jgi:nucleotide-binding universal stress UspA family protein
MYRHLMVPLDDSALSAGTVLQAVALARTLGAKVTFFHAKADYGASSIGALERVISPAAFNDNLAGEARAILAKAEVVARAAGVAYDSVVTTSDRPHEAILSAAEARGCDLIFIASHGRRGIKGLMLGSQTQKVLQHTTIPVLVSAVESNLPSADLAAPLAVIRDEHRSLAAVIHGLELLVRQAREANEPPSFPLLHAMLYYIKEFPETLHHPKEDA